jgi:hypothetical protein
VHVVPAQVVACSGSDWSLQLVPPSRLTSRALARPALHVLANQPAVAVGNASAFLSQAAGTCPGPSWESTAAPVGAGVAAASDQRAPPSDVR